MTQEEFCTTRNDLPEDLEQILSSLKKFQENYEYEQDYLKVFERIKDTNPFSILIFYEPPETRTSLAKKKRLNPHVPKRMLARMASYVQFYFVPELKEMRLGAWIGSGYRSTQSTFALALAKLSEQKDVPTHILILDSQDIMKHMLSSPRLIVQPHECTQNVGIQVVNEVLRNTVKAYSQRRDEQIESIYLVRP